MTAVSLPNAPDVVLAAVGGLHARGALGGGRRGARA